MALRSALASPVMRFSLEMWVVIIQALGRSRHRRGRLFWLGVSAEFRVNGPKSLPHETSAAPARCTHRPPGVSTHHSLAVQATWQRRPEKLGGKGGVCSGRGRGRERWYDRVGGSTADGPLVRSLLMPPDPPPRRGWFWWVLLVLLTLLLVLLGVGILDWVEL